MSPSVAVSVVRESLSCFSKTESVNAPGLFSMMPFVVCPCPKTLVAVLVSSGRDL